MKKLLLGATLIMSVIAFATSTNTQKSTTGNTIDKAYYQDTVPGKKKDTSKPWPSDTTKTPTPPKA